MNRLASPRELQAELHQLMTSLRAHGPDGKPDRLAVAAKLHDLADRVGGVKKAPKGDPRRLDEDTFSAKPFHERGTEASESWNVSDDAGNRWIARKIRGKWEYESAGKGRRASGRTSNYSDPVKRLTVAVRDAHKALAVLKKSRVSEVDYERATTELSGVAQAFHSASRDLAYWADMIEHSADKLEDALEAFPAVMSPRRDEDAAVDRSDVDRAEDSVKAVEGFVRSLG